MVLIFDIDLAKKYGDREAIFIYNFDFWLSKNIGNNRHFYDGCYWTYGSKPTYQKLFYCYSEAQIRKILESLQAQNVIKAGNYNKTKFDRTLWYTFTPEFLNQCAESNIKLYYNQLLATQKISAKNQLNLANRSVKFNRPIPYIRHNSENATHFNSSDATISKKLSIENPSDEEFPEQGFFENNEKDITKKEEPINELIIFWNKFDCFSKHKNRTTKLYKLSNRYTSEILNNKFIENHKIDKNWKINNNIKTSILKNITIKQLKQIIIKYSLQFNDNYLPENKSVLPKSFPNFIYNPKTQKSQLLWMLNHEPALKNEVTATDVSLYRNKLDTAVAHKIDELLKYKYSKISDKHRMSVYINAHNTVKQLHEIYQKVKSINKENFIIQFSGIQFVTKWLSYLENKPAIVPADFNATGFTFQNFIAYCVRQYTVDLDYSEEHIKQKTKQVKQVEVRKVQEVEVDSDNLLDIVF